MKKKSSKLLVFKKKTNSSLSFLLVKNHDKLLHIVGTFTFLIFFSFLGWVVYPLTVVLQISKEVWDKHGDRKELVLDLLSDLLGWAVYFIWFFYIR